ncbi:helix-turn-helix domain-containing protein [Hyphobacterium sp.]|uniref:helix-turn-helix domain-containing protein n=1 Tax=Hyphobacterium sp. TaxID=2004662 RepID=UPI003B52FA46
MPSHSPRSATDVDAHVGSRVRVRRQYLGMSQERLGELLGITFQQVQKYERGANRIGASRLFDLARVLDVPIKYFFDGIAERELGSPDEPDHVSETLNLIRSPDGLALAQAFSKIRAPKVRRRVVELVRAMRES